MANLEQRIWIWKINHEIDVESVITKGYIAVGEKHKDIGDFFQFKNKEELLDAIYAHYGSRQYARAAQSYINIMYEAAVGDIVAICKIESQGHYLYGWGIVSGCCEYLKDENGPIRILVDWHEPILENPVLADRLSDNEVFTSTDEAQAAQVISLLQINENETMEQAYLQDYIDLLKANHNIILNGAPGTGKTFLAKQIAEAMGKTACVEDTVASRKPKRISDVDIQQYLSSGLSVPSSKGRAEYKIVNIDNRKVSLDSSTILGYAVPYDEIIKAYEVQLWRGGQRNGYDPYSAALAKIIYEQLPMADVSSADLKKGYSNYKMVQFHPSYDYTDFVEGLRPIKDGKGNIGFERKDGVFKEFCKIALQNDSAEINNVKVHKTQVQSNDERIEAALESFRKNMDGKTIPSFRDSSNKFGIKIEGNTIKVIPASYLSLDNANEKVQYVSTPAVKKFIETGEYNKFSQSYEPSVGQYIKEHFLQDVQYSAEAHFDNPLWDEKSPFVFIIDEINRGEISKIFGELFFSIDPGYRGEKGKVQTQYQNLVEDGDVFKDGFFVPENVYIIGTMNDIDRSVESMDFAMRRRFAWHEVTAEESAKNMGLNEELVERMNSLNHVISDTEGLGSAYHVGGSFFLNVQKGEMTVESLWNLNLKSLLKEYLRGLPDADDTLKQMENAYFLKGRLVDDNEQDVSSEVEE